MPVSIAKTEVAWAIGTDETTAMAWINQQLKALNINLN